MKNKIWTCKIGADYPMRLAIKEVYYKLTGQGLQFIFSGWRAELEEIERAVVENKLPNKNG